MDAAHGVCGEEDTDRRRHARPAERAGRQVDGDRTRRRDPDSVRRFGDAARIRPGTSAGGGDRAMGSDCATRITSPSWPSRPRPVCTEPTNRRGCCGCCPTSTTCAPRSNTPSPIGISTLRCGSSHRCPSSCICASATSRPVGPSGCSTMPPPTTRCSPPRPASPREEPGTAAISAVHGRSPPLAEGRVPARGNGRVAYPGDVLADLALYEGDPRSRADALRRGDVACPRRRRPDPPGVDPVLCGDLSGGAAHRRRGRRRRQRRRSRSPTQPPTRRRGRWRATRLGLVLKKSEPDRALTLFDEAAGLAESVQNFWWHGIALMEAASTRAVHGDPATAARDLVAVHRPLGPRWGLEPAVAESSLCDPFSGPRRCRRGCGGTASRARRRRQAVTAERRTVAAMGDPPGQPLSAADAVRLRAARRLARYA